MIRDWSNFIAGRTALVTGSSGGVGRAIAMHMARAGAHVWINDLYEDRARAVAAEIATEQGQASVVVADVCDPASVAAMVAATGPVDIVVNNAGIPPEGFTIKSFVESSASDWDPIVRLNLAAVLHVTHSYLPLMIERRWGRVLTIVSDAGRRGERKQVVYGAAKAAAMGFSRGLAAEVGRDGITVNCIALGTMNHGQLAAAIDRTPELEAKLARSYPVGRVGRVDDAAPLAVLLCSDAAEWTTGQVYTVDGGYASAL